MMHLHAYICSSHQYSIYSGIDESRFHGSFISAAAMRALDVPARAVRRFTGYIIYTSIRDEAKHTPCNCAS
uniref:Uncharacterized protein n=1 Tax=Oryza punctata TaxID=4537 RepID=A0A0E0LA90_ORYPU